MSKSNSAQSNARASRKRAELLSSFDALSSHLTSTFSALSTALARASSRNGYSTDTQETVESTGAKKTGRAYLAILVGASISSAKSKVVVGINGLEVKIWGTRDDVPAPKMIVHDNNGEEAEEKDGEKSDDEKEEDE